VLHACLCWFDEHPRFLERAVYTSVRLGVERIVALDGAYKLYPGGQRTSPPEQAAAIVRAASSLGLALRFGKPKVWETELEKREAMLALVPANDWFCWLDADFEVMTSNPRLPEQLAGSDRVAADVTIRHLRGPYFPGLPPVTDFRLFYRRLPGLHYERNHYTLVAGDGRRLWGNRQHGPIEPGLDLRGQVVIAHHTNGRPVERVRRQIAYYKTRDALGVERGPCGRCGAPSLGWAPTNLTDLGNQVEVDWVEVCEDCAAVLAQENEALSEMMNVERPRLVGGPDRLRA
jgi:hypothetical protein